MDTSTLTHIAAVLVGVAITFLLVNGLNSNKAKDANPGSTSASATASSSNTNKDQKKKKKKTQTQKEGNSDGTAAAATERSIPVEEKKEEPAAPSLTREEPVKQEAAAKSGGGKKKKKKKAADKKKAPESATTASPTSNSTSISTKENEAITANAVPVVPSTKENEAITANAAPVVPSTGAVWETPPQEEEWASVPESKKKKKNRKPKAVRDAAAAASTSAAVPSSDSVIVDAKKIGIIIGPKGATMQALQEATGCQLDINAPAKDEKKPAPKATVVLTGPNKDAINKAKKAISELASKGYATILQSDNFGEFSILVHPRFLSEIVGPNGNTIKALQTTLDVKITIPPTDWKPNVVQVGQVRPVKVGIAGSKENSKTCKAAIQYLMKYHHHEITHPKVIHEEVYVPSEFFHCIIGPRGSEIKHIRGNYKVDIYMPNAESETENVIVVGKQTNVDKAISYIQLLMDRDSEQRDNKYSDEYYG